MSSSVTVSFAPRLVEAVVRHELDRRAPEDPDRAEYRRLLDDIYAHTGPARAEASSRVHATLFSRLGWPVFFTGLLPAFLGKLDAARVLSAEGNEGCFLSPDRTVLLIRLERNRFDAPPELRTYLRHELVHVQDMLDPAFGYRDEAIDEPTRLRYASLWCASIDARLSGRALEPATHGGLLDRARSLARPACPLCRLPTACWAEATEDVAPRVRQVLPEWSPEQGLCERCREWAELFPT